MTLCSEYGGCSGHISSRGEARRPCCGTGLDCNGIPSLLLYVACRSASLACGVLKKKKEGGLWVLKEVNSWFSCVFNTVYTSCRTNKVRVEETTAWFGKLPGVGDRNERLVLAPPLTRESKRIWEESLSLCFFLAL